jgi:hypothetical protein
VDGPFAGFLFYWPLTENVGALMGNLDQRSMGGGLAKAPEGELLRASYGFAPSGKCPRRGGEFGRCEEVNE